MVVTGPVYAPMKIAGEWVAINRTIGTVHVYVHIEELYFFYTYTYPHFIPILAKHLLK